MSSYTTYHVPILIEPPQPHPGLLHLRLPSLLPKPLYFLTVVRDFNREPRSLPASYFEAFYDAPVVTGTRHPLITEPDAHYVIGYDEEWRQIIS